MSEMHETSQSAIRPYVSTAEVAFLMNSVTAVFSSALLVNRQGLGGSDGEGGGSDGGDGGGGMGGGGVSGGDDGGGDL